MIELTISIRTSESTLKHKVLVHESVELDRNDDTIKEKIAEALELLNIESNEIEDIKIRALLVVK